MESNLFENNSTLTEGLDRIAYWGRFFGVFTVIGGVLMVLLGIAMLSIDSMSAIYDQMGMGYLTSMLAFFYVGLAIPYLWSGIQLNKTARGCRKALTNKDEAAMSTGLMELGKLFRVWGIITVLFLALYGVAFIAGFLAS